MPSAQNGLMAMSGLSFIISSGYRKEAYEAQKEKYPQIVCVFSPHYAETNSMYSLWNCHEAIGDDDFILLESDIVYRITELQENEQSDIMLITPRNQVPRPVLYGV